MTPYQKRIAGMLDAGATLQERMRRTGFGICWDHRVTVLVDADGNELETVNARSVAALVIEGYDVEKLLGGNWKPAIKN